MMEIGLIIVMAVVLFPAKELPKLARTIARFYGQIRKTAEDFRSSVLDDEDLRSPIDDIKGAYNDARFEVRDTERKARQQLAKAQMELRMATARRLQAEREAEAEGQTEGDGQGSGDDEGAKASSDEGVSGAAAPSAISAGPVRIAASEDDEGEDEAAASSDAGFDPVAAPDPRVVAARRPPPYTPGTSDAKAEAAPSKGDADKPREGVA